MKRLDYILFSLSVAFFVMGIYEIMVVGVAAAYGFMMISLILLFIFGYRKLSRKGDE